MRRRVACSTVSSGTRQARSLKTVKKGYLPDARADRCAASVGGARAESRFNVEYWTVEALEEAIAIHGEAIC